MPKPTCIQCGTELSRKAACICEPCMRLEQQQTEATIKWLLNKTQGEKPQ